MCVFLSICDWDVNRYLSFSYSTIQIMKTNGSIHQIHLSSIHYPSHFISFFSWLWCKEINSSPALVCKGQCLVKHWEALAAISCPLSLIYSIMGFEMPKIMVDEKYLLEKSVELKAWKCCNQREVRLMGGPLRAHSRALLRNSQLHCAN